jgi:ABC-type antimicrobial peptide transport system permease subunit
VGVVSDVRHNGITASISEKWYRPHSQFHHSSGFTPPAMTLTIRTSVPPESLAGPVRAIVRELDPKLPLAQVRTLDQVRSASVAESRFTMALLVLLSALALVLAAVGVYGVISYVVSQRTTEIGIRLALGSTPRGVLGLVVRQGLLMSVLGVAIGAIVAVMATGFLDSVLYGVRPRDPVTFALVPVVLLAAAFAGVLVPALRAARVDPVIALRAD